MVFSEGQLILQRESSYLSKGTVKRQSTEGETHHTRDKSLVSRIHGEVAQLTHEEAA